MLVVRLRQPKHLVAPNTLSARLKMLETQGVIATRLYERHPTLRVPLDREREIPWACAQGPRCMGKLLRLNSRTLVSSWHKCLSRFPVTVKEQTYCGIALSYR